MNRIEIALADVPLTGHDLQSPVRIPLKPQPVPPRWEELLFSRWLEAQHKSGKFPDLMVISGTVTLACRREDYRQFFHEELEQKVAETNDLFNRQIDEAAQRVVDEEKATHAAGNREVAQQRLKEVAAFNELRQLREGSAMTMPMPQTVKKAELEMVSHRS